jgi:hypothetical protein
MLHQLLAPVLLFKSLLLPVQDTIIGFLFAAESISNAVVGHELQVLWR